MNGVVIPGKPPALTTYLYYNAQHLPAVTHDGDDTQSYLK